MIENNADGSRMTNFEFIVRLYEKMLKNDYKKNWVYCQFIQGAQFSITQNDFEKMAKLLGYSKGWAFYKHRDYKDDKKRIRIEQDDNARQYARDNRYSDGLSVNKNF